MTIECWAKIPDDNERKTVFAWVRRTANEGYSEIGDELTLVYHCDLNQRESKETMCEIIRTFEAFPEHAISRY